MGASGSIPEERKATLHAKAVVGFRKAVQMFELDPEGLLVMMDCILRECEAKQQTIADYHEAEKGRCVVVGRQISPIELIDLALQRFFVIAFPLPLPSFLALYTVLQLLSINTCLWSQ